jgi:hypothetical protein
MTAPACSDTEVTAIKTLADLIMTLADLILAPGGLTMTLADLIVPLRSPGTSFHTTAAGLLVRVHTGLQRRRYWIQLLKPG